MRCRRKDLSGLKSGKLTFLEPLRKYHTNWVWKVQCECGNFRELPSSAFSRVKSCGCQKPKRYIPGGFSVFNSAWTHYRTSAARRGLEFSLDRKLFEELMKGNCTFCDAPPTERRYSLSQKAYPVNGIDRLDPYKGYTDENCVTCCWTCNKLKGSFSQEEFLAQVRKISSFIGV